MRQIYFLAVSCVTLLMACGPSDSETQKDEATLDGVEEVVVETEPDEDIHSVFLENLRNLCGHSYMGKALYPLNEPDHPFADQPIIVSFSVCEEDTIHMPLQVGEDMSRTWMLTLTDEGLLLKHDHRHKDGTPEELTMYGGYATDEGTEWSQFFPADEETADMLPEATTNVWNMVINEEDETFEYILHRHGELRFHAAIDISKPATL
nr:hypothetical protein [Saprospiraceae bacterium]